MSAVAVEMMDFKKNVLEGDFPVMYVPYRLPEPKHFGLFLMTKVIPTMEEKGEVAFYWHWDCSDVSCATKAAYERETKRYKDELKMKCEQGNSTWFYDYKRKDGKKRRCVIETEIWYIPDANHRLSPCAVVFNQMFGNGYHFAKCRWEDVE